MDDDIVGSQQKQRPEEGIPEGEPLPLHRDTTISVGRGRRENTGGGDLESSLFTCEQIKRDQFSRYYFSAETVTVKTLGETQRGRGWSAPPLSKGWGGYCTLSVEVEVETEAVLS